MTTSQFSLWNALDIRRAIAQGQVTAEQVTAEALDRAETAEPALQAWVTLDRDGALEAARKLDRGADRGPLHGVPIGVKDLFAVRGLPWRAGSPIYRDRIATSDASAVMQARQAGAVILGKTHTTEFASFTPAPTHNPRVPGATPGGSSSGSAAAVAAGIVPVAFGTQTSGSIVRPASYCGVVGFKPTFDYIDTTGVTPLARSLDTIGVIAGTVSDAALFTDALTGAHLLDATRHADDAPVSLGICCSPAWDTAEPALVRSWEAFIAMLGKRCRLTDIDCSAFADIGAAHARLMAHEAAQALAWENAVARKEISPALQAQIDEGEQPYEVWHSDVARLHQLRAVFRELPGPARVWITPATTGPAPNGLASTGNPAFNRLWSFAGTPACTVPLLSDEGGRPMGVQVVGAIDDDSAVIAVARWLEHFGSQFRMLEAV